MKRVLFVATVTNHINAFHIPYLKWFKERNYEVHVASKGEQKIPYCDKHFNLQFERSPIKKKNLDTYKELKTIINENSYNIIHCHTPVGGILTRLAARKARKRGTKIIYTAHGFHFYKGSPILNWLIYYPIEKFMSRYTDCLITINKEDYELAKNKLKAKETVLINGVGIDRKKFDFTMTEQEKQILRESLSLDKNDFIIIYPAELSKRKNQGMLIKAVAKLKDRGNDNIKVILAGKDSMNGEYQKLARDLNVEKEIKFLGRREDIPKLLKISDLLVSTSKQEGLPVNVMEAMFSNVPIIATNCRGNRDIAQKTVEIDDIDQLCSYIQDALSNKEKYICKINDKYELKNVLNQTKMIYERG